MSPIVCRACGTRFPAKRFSQENWQSLTELHYFDEAVAELAMLRKVEAFYARHPYAEGKINPHFIDVLDSDDPAVQEQMAEGVPFDEIELPQQTVVVPRMAEDAEVIDYLRHHHFDLSKRLPGIAETVAAGRQHIATVRCPHCQDGELFVPPENFWAFQEATEDCTTFYWPEWHSLDDDGTLHVKTTGFIGMTHWNGETVIKPQQPEYLFWRWFLAQPEHQHLMNDEEFERIRAKYEREATRSN
jgi:hypothetical protein